MVLCVFVGFGLGLSMRQVDVHVPQPFQNDIVWSGNQQFWSTLLVYAGCLCDRISCLVILRAVQSWIVA